MIKSYTRLPEYYYRESRDFQLFGRIFEAVFNYYKTTVDCVKNNPISKDSDTNLLDLVSTTLGFESKHNYDVNDLKALCNSFMYILRRKGTKEAVEDCVKLLLKSQSVDESFDVNIRNYEIEGGQRVNVYSVDIYLPSEITDLALLEDMLDYVLPAGYNYKIIVSAILPDTLQADLTTEDSVQFNTDSSGEPVYYSDKLLSHVAGGGVEISANDLANVTKGLADNTVVIKYESGEE